MTVRCSFLRISAIVIGTEQKRAVVSTMRDVIDDPRLEESYSAAHGASNGASIMPKNRIEELSTITMDFGIPTHGRAATPPHLATTRRSSPPLPPPLPPPLGLYLIEG